MPPLPLPSWLRDDDDTYVNDPRAIQLACEYTGVDKEDWFHEEVPDEVWDLLDAEDATEEVAEPR